MQCILSISTPQFCINTTIPRRMTIHRTCKLVSIYKSAKSALGEMETPRKYISSSGVLRNLNMTYRLGPGLSLHTRAACCCQGLFYITTLLSVATIHSVGGGWHYYGAMVWWYGLVNQNIRGGGDLSQCHSAHHKSHTDWSSIEPGNTV